MEDQSEDVESHEEDGGERWYSLLLMLLFGDVLSCCRMDFYDFSSFFVVEESVRSGQ